MRVRSFFRLSVFVAAFLCLSPFVNAQPGDGGIDPDPVNGGSAPLDLGVSALVLAGIGYAAKKRYEARKKEKLTGHSEK